MVDLVVSVCGFADANSDAWKGVVGEGFDDGFEAVVPAVAAGSADADAARCKVDVVGDDDEARGFGLVVV